MYVLFTWAVISGPADEPTVTAAAFAALPPSRPHCVLAPGHSLIYRVPVGNADAEYEQTLNDLLSVSHAFDEQLRFALVMSSERNLDGAGFDKQLARQIIK